MKLRQVCCDPRLVSVSSARTVTSSAKFDLFFELVTTQLEQGRRVLVFSQFTRMLALLSAGPERAQRAHGGAHRLDRRSPKSRAMSSSRARPTCS